MASASEVSRYRTGVANLLKKQVEVVSETERRLDIAVDGGVASWRADLEGDPTGSLRIMTALLLRKAKLHMIAMLRANERNNVHSLAVQARPVLECAGQVVLTFHHLVIAPDLSVVDRYMNADFYGAFIGSPKKGGISHDQLLKMISKASWMSGKGRSLKQADKVAELKGGRDWYRYLSNYFCHGEADWRGHSWQGGVSSMNTVHEFTLAGIMDYLVNQVAAMTAYAALCPVAGAEAHGQRDAALAQMQEVRAASKALRDGVELAGGNPQEEGPS